MLKIAYISPSYFSVADLPLINQLRELCDIHYYVHLPHDGKGHAINISKMPKSSGIYLGTQFDEMQIFSGYIDLSKTHIIYHESPHSWAISNIRVTKQLLNELKKQNFDIIHITDPYRYFEFPLYKFRKKTVLTVHDPFIHSSQKKWYAKRFYRFLSFKLIKKFILFNQAQQADFMRTWELSEEQVYLSRLGIYNYLQLYEKPAHNNADYALYIGTIRSHKGVEYLLEAFEQVHAKDDKARLIVAGAGNFYFDVSPYLNKPYITFIHKYLTTEEQVELISNAKYIVCPYKDATQSGVVMSAFAFNKPCIATNVGGLPEMVIDNKYGKIVPPSSSEELAKAMLLFNENPANILLNYSNNIFADFSTGEKSWKSIAKNTYQNVYERMIRQ